MKINKRSIRKSVLTAMTVILMGFVSSCGDLWSEQHPGTFYISDGQSVATFLEEYPNNEFSDFIKILKRAELWEDLKTYGDRTCFAPKNVAIQKYLQERARNEKDPDKAALFESVETIPLEVADSLARAHICRESIMLKDLNKQEDGPLPASNLLDRYLTYTVTTDSVTDPENPTVTYLINQFSEIIEPDDSLVNGIVQVIGSVISQSNLFIPGYLDANNKKTPYSSHQAKLFYQAITATGLTDDLEAYKDPTYPVIGYDSTYACLEFTSKVAVEYETAYETGDQRQRVVWPNERLFKFTLFAVSDSILEAKYNITNLDQLREFAKGVYNDPVHVNDEDTLKTSPLYKLISYHILPCWLKRNLLNLSDPDYVVQDYLDSGNKNHIDIADFYETMHPYAILRISTPYDDGSKNNGKEIYINRKGTVSDGNLTHPGIRILRTAEVSDLITTDALNGGYYFIDNLLLFNDDTKAALNTRLRFLGNTLSPDFINSGARGDRIRQKLGDKATTFACYSFKNGFCKNVSCSDQTLFVVRYQDKNWDIYFHDELNIRGLFDITFRLPPVPVSGTYEIRVWGNALSGSQGKDRGIVQFLISEDGENFTPTDIPTDMSKPSSDPSIGYISDSDLRDQVSGDGEEAEAEREALIIANDKAMRNRGYMKAPDSYGHNTGSYANLRDKESCFRKIVVARQFDAGKDYYLRMRQVKDDENSVYAFNILEIVPKDIYAGSVPEDRH